MLRAYQVTHALIANTVGCWQAPPSTVLLHSENLNGKSMDTTTVRMYSFLYVMLSLDSSLLMPHYSHYTPVQFGGVLCCRPPIPLLYKYTALMDEHLQPSESLQPGVFTQTLLCCIGASS